MPSELQRVAQALLAALDEVPRVVDYLLGTAQKCRENAGYLGHMSNNPAARLAARQLDEAAMRCEEAAHYLAQAPPKARRWAEQMVSGGAGRPTGRIGEQQPGSSGGGITPGGRRQDYKAAPGGNKAGTPPGTGDGADPEGQTVGGGSEQFRPVAREILERLPLRGRRDKTRGVWIDADGNEQDLISGIDDYTSDAQRFMDEHGIEIAPGDITLGSHVEVKFAMFMRKHGLTDEIITINNWPCPGPYGCDQNLFRFLPDGARLTVFGPAGFKETYPRPDEGLGT
jgi:hypothetical protein